MSQPLFNQQEQKVLLQLARDSVEHGLLQGKPLEVNLQEFDSHLQEPGAAFVTLEKRSELRGCIGSVEAHRPLVEDIAENAWAAAFRDPRFSPVTRIEFFQLHFEISVLTSPQPMQFESEDDLKQQIVAGKDGLLIREGVQRGLFLPAVWGKLPDVDSFLSHLKQKAGLSSNYWSDRIEINRFYSFEFSDD